MVEIVDSDGWIEVKGSDVLLKNVSYKAPLSMKSNTGGESTSEVGTDDEKGPLVRIDDTVLINITARQCNDRNTHWDGPIVLQGKSWVVGIGDLDVLPKCVELGIQHMHAGDTSYIVSTPEYAFGLPTTGGSNNNSTDNTTGTKVIDSVRKYKVSPKDDEYILPSSSSVLFIIELLQIVADTSRLNPYFPIQKATTRKLIANDIYQNEWHAGGKARERCIRLYERVVKDMKKLLYDGTYFNQVEADHPQKKQVKQLLVDSLNNIAAVYMSAKRYQLARQHVLEILDKHDTKNLKALLRYVKCCVLDKDCDDTTINDSFKKADNILSYHNTTEQEEIKKLRIQYKRRTNK